jgi:hypothetical protein
MGHSELKRVFATGFMFPVPLGDSLADIYKSHPLLAVPTHWGRSAVVGLMTGLSYWASLSSACADRLDKFYDGRVSQERL